MQRSTTAFVQSGYSDSPAALTALGLSRLLVLGVALGPPVKPQRLERLLPFEMGLVADA